METAAAFLRHTDAASSWFPDHSTGYPPREKPGLGRRCT